MAENDLLIGMDRANLRNMYRIRGGDFMGKMHLLLEGCRGLVKKIKAEINTVSE